MSHKISDSGFGAKPFDLFQLAKAPAFVAVFWYEKPGDKRMSLIDIDKWNEEEENSARKSLTYERSCVIGRCEEL